MNVLQYPESMDASAAASDVQIWNNAAFDDGEFEDSDADMAAYWSPVKPIIFYQSDSFYSSSAKENQSPSFEKSTFSVRSPEAVKPLHPSNALPNSQKNSIKQSSSKKVFAEKEISRSRIEEEIEVRDAKKIDAEIEEIKKQINRWTSRLESLRTEKLLKNSKISERKGRVVQAKFIDPKQGANNTEEMKKVEESLSMNTKPRIEHRGANLGAADIIAKKRRGSSLGPSDITKSRGLNKPEITPVQTIQNRRKSCFWKLQGIDEKTVATGRGKSSSPKSRKTVSKAQDLRQAVTTIGGKKAVKKEDGIMNSIQPKKLFKDGEKSVRKPMNPGRVVASRYNQTNVTMTPNSSVRKWSLQGNGKDESMQSEKKPSLTVGKSRPTVLDVSRTDYRVKKRWEIPSEVVILKNLEGEKSPSVTGMNDLLPKIRTLRCTNEISPRDSGAAKRVAELVRSKSFFINDEEVEPPVCQILSFAEDDLE